MTRLARTEGLTEDQRDILAAVHEFVEDQIIPVATTLEHADEYPQAIVDGLKELGVFGLMIPEEYGGLGESLLTYALVVEEIARGWMSVSGVINTHFIVAWMLVAFVLVHVFEVIVTGFWNNVRSMITGRYRVPKDGSHE